MRRNERCFATKCCRKNQRAASSFSSPLRTTSSRALGAWMPLRLGYRNGPQRPEKRVVRTYPPLASACSVLLDRDYFFAVDLGAASGHQYAKNASGIHSKGN